MVKRISFNVLLELVVLRSRSLRITKKANEIEAAICNRTNHQSAKQQSEIKWKKGFREIKEREKTDETKKNTRSYKESRR